MTPSRHLERGLPCKRSLAQAFAVSASVLMLLLIIALPAVQAGVTRSISAWNCPQATGTRPATVTLIADGNTGRYSGYRIVERLPSSWIFRSPWSYHSTPMGDGTTTYSIEKHKDSLMTTYTVTIPGTVGAVQSFSGRYIEIDAGNPVAQPIVGDSIMRWQNNTCIAGSADDMDGDHYGRGCSCLGPDCDDANYLRHPNATRVPGTIDMDCSGVLCTYPESTAPQYYQQDKCGGVPTPSERELITTRWLNGQINVLLSLLISFIPATFQG